MLKYGLQEITIAESANILGFDNFVILSNSSKIEVTVRKTQQYS